MKNVSLELEEEDDDEVGDEDEECKSVCRDVENRVPPTFRWMILGSLQEGGDEEVVGVAYILGQKPGALLSLGVTLQTLHRQPQRQYQ